MTRLRTNTWCPATMRPCHEAGECEIDGTCKRDTSRRVILRREYENVVGQFLLDGREMEFRTRLLRLGFKNQQVDQILNTRRVA